MNCDLKTLDLTSAVAEKCDLLVLLVPDGFAPGDDALSAIVAQATKAKDLETKPGKSLQLYQAPGIAARRVVLAGVGKCDARSIRQAFAAIGATQQVLDLAYRLVGLALPLVSDVMEAVDDAPCQALRGGFQPRVPQDVEKCRDNQFDGELCFPWIGHVGRHLLTASSDADAFETGGEGGVEVVGGGRCLLRDECGDVGKRAVRLVDLRHVNLLLKRKRFPLGHGLRAAGSRIAERDRRSRRWGSRFFGAATMVE